MSKAKKRAIIESDSDDSGSSDIEQVCGDTCRLDTVTRPHFASSEALSHVYVS